MQSFKNIQFHNKNFGGFKTFEHLQSYVWNLTPTFTKKNSNWIGRVTIKSKQEESK